MAFLVRLVQKPPALRLSVLKKKGKEISFGLVELQSASVCRNNQ